MPRATRISSVDEIPKNQEVLIFLACFNRAEMSRSAAESLCQQTLAPQVSLIISDNSTTDVVESWVNDYDFKIKTYYLKRLLTLPPPHAHARQIFLEVMKLNPNYWMLFHDDDLAYPSMVEKLHGFLESHPECSAVAPNAISFASSGFVELNRKSLQDLRLSQPRELLEKYFRPSLGVAPCPGYFYRGSVARLIEIGLQGGKYMDIWTNCLLFSWGQLHWLGEPLLLYRRHQSQDSLLHSVAQKQALMRALLRRGILKPGDPILDWFRIQNLKHRIQKKSISQKLGILLTTKAGRLALGGFLKSLGQSSTWALLLNKFLGRYESLSQWNQVQGRVPSSLVKILESEVWWKAGGRKTS